MKASRLGFLSVALVLGLAACEDIISPPDAGPAINSFTATPSVISAGETSTLQWDVDSSATEISISPDVGVVTGETSATVTPSTTTEYTLTAEGADGTSQATTTVTVEGDGNGSGGVPDPDPIDPGDPTSAPEGTFGVSETPDGTFTSDAGENITSNDDERIITVGPGDTFYAQVAYADSDGIADITLLLVNSSPEGLSGPLGTTPQGGFTVGEPTGDCELADTPTTVTCVYPITVGADVLDIEELEGAGNEFAYVFRVLVEDTAGNVAGVTQLSDRGYVNIE